MKNIEPNLIPTLAFLISALGFLVVYSLRYYWKEEKRIIELMPKVPLDRLDANERICIRRIPFSFFLPPDRRVIAQPWHRYKTDKHIGHMSLMTGAFILDIDPEIARTLKKNVPYSVRYTKTKKPFLFKIPQQSFYKRILQRKKSS